MRDWLTPLVLVVSLIPGWSSAQTVVGVETDATEVVLPTPRAFQRAVDLVDRLYMYPDQIDQAGLLGGALAGLADEVSWLLVHPTTQGPPGFVLTHGAGHPVGTLRLDQEPLPDLLATAERLVSDAGFPMSGVNVRLALLSGLADALDVHSRILSGERLDRFDVRIKGTLTGVGATVSQGREHLWISRLETDGPAVLAGLQVGDVLERIDGSSTANMPSREATQRLRGEVGTIVTLEIRRGDESMVFAITRDEVIVQNVHRAVLDDQVGYVKIDHISLKTVHNLRGALGWLRDQGALANGLVLDLRHNTGGAMREAAEVADLFLDGGLLLRSVGPGGQPVTGMKPEMQASRTGEELPIPVVVLVDDRTASASEIVAGALREHDRVALVGTRTYGKGEVQKVYPLEDDIRLKLTVAEYLLEGDLRVAGGLVPDVVIGEIELDEYGVKYVGFRFADTGVAWSEVLPQVLERQGWRGSGEAYVDLPLEVARRALLLAEYPTRQAVLETLATVSKEVRRDQEAHLAEALQARGLDWTASATQGGPSSVRVDVAARPDKAAEGGFRVRAAVENLGEEPLHQVIVELACDGLSVWDGVAVPIGRVEPGGRGEGEAFVTLMPGIDPREDEVDLVLHVHGRPDVALPSEVLSAQSTSLPRLRIEAAWNGAPVGGEGVDREALVTVRNLSNEPLTGVEVYLGLPGDVGVELLDRAARIPNLKSRGSETITVRMRVESGAPSVLPMDLRVDADRFGSLLDWKVDLRLDNSSLMVEAPRIEARPHLLSASVGPYTLPFLVTDDVDLEYVTLYVNDHKVHWMSGAKRVDGRGQVELVAGENRLRVVARDNQGLIAEREFVVRGEPSEASADAAQ